MDKKQGGSESLFGKVRMGYAVIASPRRDSWQRLLGEGLGMQADVLGDGALSARIDDHERRLLVVPGNSEDLEALGLEMADEQALGIVLKRLSARAIAVEEGDAQAARQRGVKRFWRFTGPKGLKIELFCEPNLVAAKPKMITSGFVTGDKGFGHIAVTTRRPDAARQFWSEIFDIRHSDDVQQSISGIPLCFEFFRFNERHHSIALAYTPKIKLDPIRTRIQHLEVQAATLDDMSAAYERCRKLGFFIAMGVGQHANDKALSFYVRTPSGFDMEYGWNPLSVDETEWRPALWDRISIWGHWPQHERGERLAQLGRAVASLMRTEFVPAGF